MSVFSYQATDDRGKMITGVMEAKDKAGVIAKLQSEKYFPIQVEPEQKAKPALISITFKRSAIPQKELMNFTRQMATLLRSGLELDRCLEILVKLTEKDKTGEVVKQVREDLLGGETLSRAMAKRENAFSPLYLNMVKAGEAGGFLENAFDRLAWYLESRMKMTESVRSAMVYPAVIFLTGIAALLILTTHVIPRFGAIFEQMGGELPLSTRFLVGTSDFVLGYWPIMAVSTVAVIALLKAYLRTENGKRAKDSVLLELPLVGDLVRKTTVAQFTRTLGTLLQSGVPIVRALSIVKETVGNIPLADALKKTASAIKEGKRMSSVLKSTGIFPQLAIQMIMVGEEGGNLDEMLLRTAHIYDDEVDIAVKRILTLFEPAMILLMGLVVAFVIVSMLSAIVSINDLPF